MRRPGETSHVLMALCFAALLATVVGTGSVWAAFSSRTASPGDSVTASSDWVAPSASSSVIGKSGGGTPGFIRQGGSYHVYAAASDGGQIPSGIAGVTANAASLTTGRSALSLAPGSFTTGAQSYNYRSAVVTANATLAAGTYGYSLTSTDNAGNGRVQSGFTVTVDNTAPIAADIQTTNKSGNLAGRPDAGDTVVFTFSEPIDPTSVLAGWTGAATSVVTRIDDTGFSANDRLSVYNAANAVQLPLGTVNLGSSSYVAANTTFGATGTKSTMVISGNALTITLGTPSTIGSDSSFQPASMIWSPSASAFDRAGNAQSTATRTETGTSDRDF